jgi:hypothetical protein
VSEADIESQPGMKRAMWAKRVSQLSALPPGSRRQLGEVQAEA